MSRRFAQGLLLLFVFLGQAAMAQNTSTSDKKESYESIVKRLKDGDIAIDFRQLRLAYAGSANYQKDSATDPQREAMVKALDSKDFSGAIQNADIVLASNYVDMDSHLVEFIANTELKVLAKAEFHKFVLQSLLKSITDSGDGKTPETAFEVIDVREEFVLLQLMGVGLPESQSLLQKNGHSYDEIKFKNPSSGESVTIYFNVDIPTKHGT
jgi:hypothetical protein